MKKLYILFFAILISGLSFGQIINEFEPNPTGTDPTNVSFEIKGTPSASFSGWILSIESDAGGTAPGVIDRAAEVSGTFDSNGLLVVDVPDLENPSFTVVLTANFTGTVGTTDIDTNDDGTVDDISTFGTVYDAIGIPDTTGEPLYGSQLSGADFTYTGSEPELVFRDGASDDWFAVNTIGDNTSIYDITATTVSASNFDVDPSTSSTFGSVNPIYTPSSCNVTFETESYTCNANTTGGSDSVTITIPYTGSDNTITSVTTTSGGSIGGDDPSTTTDGTITITGLTEGNAWDVTLNGGQCDGTTISGTVSASECLPTPCYDLTGGAYEFGIVQITANDQGDNWKLESGEYSINGYCPGCTNATTDSWLIFGPVDMTSATNVQLVFDAMEGFSGSDLEVFYTNSYSGSPDTTTWTTAQTISSGSEGYYNIDIPSTGSLVYLGIQYADGDGTYSAWTIANAGLYADNCATLGTSKNQIQGFAMYPNPTNLGYVMFSSKNNAKMKVSIFDLLGKQVLNEAISDNRLNVSSLKCGIYLIKVTQDQASITKKLVIQ